MSPDLQIPPHSQQITLSIWDTAEHPFLLEMPCGFWATVFTRGSSQFHLDCRVEMPPFSPDAQQAHLPVGAEGGRGWLEKPRNLKTPVLFWLRQALSGPLCKSPPSLSIPSSFVTKDHHGLASVLQSFKKPTHMRELEHQKQSQGHRGAPFCDFSSRLNPVSSHSTSIWEGSEGV